jgi:putative sterol carrier protein
METQQGFLRVGKGVTVGKFIDRLAHAWNAFVFSEKNPDPIKAGETGQSYSYRPDRPRFRYQNQKTIVSAIYTRIAIDVAAVPLRHVRLDQNAQYQEDIQSGLQNCLRVEANIDQGARMFRQDLAQTLFDEGVVAVLPVDTTLNPFTTGGYDIASMRVGKVVQWYPKHVKIRAYNDNKGIQEEVIMPKGMVAIIENPLYSVMNEPSSTLQRLLRKLNLLDAVDEQSASGNLDLIIQLPYVIKTETRRQEAEKRLKEIEFQLKGSQYGIAYTDGTEKVTQLNRPATNNLMDQITFLTAMLYGQLGITDAVMNGTADEMTMLNYYNRTIEPILAAITEAMARSFLTKTARSQGQTVVYIRDPFKLVPVKDLAEIADKFTRNEVLSSNDMRSIIGFRPSNDPKADKLVNKNLPLADTSADTAAGQKLADKLEPVPPGFKPAPLPKAAPLSAPQGVNGQNGTSTA